MKDGTYLGISLWNMRLSMRAPCRKVEGDLPAPISEVIQKKQAKLQENRLTNFCIKMIVRYNSLCQFFYKRIFSFLFHHFVDNERDDNVSIFLKLKFNREPIAALFLNDFVKLWGWWRINIQYFVYFLGHCGDFLWNLFLSMKPLFFCDQVVFPDPLHQRRSPYL